MSVAEGEALPAATETPPPLPRGPLPALLARLRTRGFGRNVAVVMGGTVAGQLLLVAVSPVVTRIFGPADFGLLAVYSSTLTIALAFAALRYEMAVPVAADDDAALNLVALSVAITALFTAVLALLLPLVGPALLTAVKARALLPYAWLLPVGFFAGGLYLSLSAWTVRRGGYGVIARTRLSQSVGQVALQLGGGVLGWGAVALLLSDVVGRASGVMSFSLLLARERPLRGRVTLRRMREQAWRFRRFPLISSTSTALNTSGLMLPALLLAALFGPAVAGWFALGQRVIGVPLTWIGQSMAQVFFSEAARLAREDRPAMRSLFHRTTGRLLRFGALPLVAGGLLAPWVFPLVFGGQWPESGWYVLLLTPMLVGQFVVSPVSQVVFAIERQDLQLGWDALRFACVLGVFGAAAALGWTPRTVVAAYSLTTCVLYAVLYALYRRAINRFVDRIDA